MRRYEDGTTMANIVWSNSKEYWTTLDRELENLGDICWELTGISHITLTSSDGYTCFIFKRPKEG
jgi:hypothetical protein